MVFLWNDVKSAAVFHSALAQHVCDMHQKCVRQRRGFFVLKTSKREGMLSGKNTIPRHLSEHLSGLETSREFL